MPPREASSLWREHFHDAFCSCRCKHSDGTNCGIFRSILWLLDEDASTLATTLPTPLTVEKVGCKRTIAATPRSLHFAWDRSGRQRMFHALIAITSPTNGFGREIEPATIEALPFAMLVGNVKSIHLLLGLLCLDCLVLDVLFWQRW